MTQVRFVWAFLLITLLILASSLPSSGAHAHHHETHALSTTPFKRGLMSHLSNSGLLQPKKKLRVYMKKKASSGGLANRARGRSSAAVSVHHQLSSFHVGSVFACSLVLAGFFKL